MRAKRAQSGQIMPLVALLTVVIVGMAAFAIDGSNLYSQHRRWQADLDVSVKVAAAGLSSSTSYTGTLTQAMFGLTTTLAQDGYPLSSPTTTTPISGTNYNYGACVSTSGITLCNPPVSTPFKGLSHYVQGVISFTVPGFFGKVIGLGRMHINVQAVAKHTDSITEKPYTIVALDTIPVPNQCAIEAHGSTGASVYVDGSIRSNQVNCATTNFPYTVTGSSEMPGSATDVGKTLMAGQLGTYTGLNPTSDPYPPMTLTPLPPTANCYTGSNGVAAGVKDGAGTVCAPVPTTCISETDSYLGLPLVPLTPVTSTNIYYFGGVTNTVQLPSTPVQIQWSNSSPNSTYDLLPGCDGTVTGTVPGVFYFTGTIQNTGSQVINIESFSSTVVLPDATSASFTMKTTAASTLALQAPGPGSGPYAGIALTQLRTTDATTGQLTCGASNGHGLSSITLAGSGTISKPVYTVGIIDAPCTSVTINGNGSTNCSSPDIQGAIVANDWSTGGSSEVCIKYDSQFHSFSGGAVLVY